MITNNNKDIDNIYYQDSKDGRRRRIITYVYYQGRKLWELIIGFLFTKDGFSLQTKDGTILKTKDQ